MTFTIKILVWEIFFVQGKEGSVVDRKDGWYAKDTSKKIKAVFKARMRDEKCVSGAVPYGYYRKPEDKQTLYVDELSASVVRRIFQFACKGMGATAIADGLPNRCLAIW